MISIFDDKGNRLSVTWQTIEFNDPTLTRSDAGGKRLESVGFSTPMNFHSEVIPDIVKNGGGMEFYNPFVANRILSMRGSIRADTESELMNEIVIMQRIFHPLMLQSELAKNRGGTATWPAPVGLPTWVREYPLKFTRCLPKSTDPTGTPSGLILMQYHVVPITLPDPVRMSVLQGVGVDYEAQFLLMDGGRSFSQTESSIAGNTTVTWTWGQAPAWPVFSIAMSAQGHASYTITTTGAPMNAVLVLNLSTLVNGDVVTVDTRDRSIWVGSTLTPSLYVSGDYPILRGNGTTGVAYTNTTAATTTMTYRQSDYV